MDDEKWPIEPANKISNLHSNSQSKKMKKKKLIRSHPPRMIQDLALLENTIVVEDKLRKQFHDSRYDIVKPRNPIFGTEDIQEHYFERQPINKYNTGEDPLLSTASMAHYTEKEYQSDLQEIDGLRMRKFAIEKELRKLEAMMGSNSNIPSRQLTTQQDTLFPPSASNTIDSYKSVRNLRATPVPATAAIINHGRVISMIPRISTCS